MDPTIVIFFLIIIGAWALNSYSNTRRIQKTARKIIEEHLRMRDYADSFNSPSNDAAVSHPPLGQTQKINGVRTCAVCGKGWESAAAQFKDLGLLGNVKKSGGSFHVAYSSADLMGLTCQGCGRAFCTDHLGQPIPTSLPGGRCPICMETLDLA